jgi:mersacidin/lichenicidin family type 2 lantibiotic
MASRDLVRAWKDEEYRLSLGEAERAHLPENPAGSLELTDAELECAAGGVCVISVLIGAVLCVFLSVLIINLEQSPV